MLRNELLIEAAELAEIINDPALRLFDATVVFDPNAETAHERYLKGHIPGAAFLDHTAISDPASSLMYTLPNEETLGRAIGALGISNDSIVVIYSAEMMPWASRVWWVLQYAGHRNVRVLNGGLAPWAGDLVSNEQRYDPASFKTHLSPGMFASKEEVLAAVTDGSSCVVNTLTPEIYRGEGKVPYAGHITGSINHPVFDLLDNGYLLPDADLKQKFTDRIPGERLITYCGGGIAATLNACAARLAGFSDVAVYDGSMSEWLAEDLPVTQGQNPGEIKK